MGAFSEAVRSKAKAPKRTAVLHPSHFADDWPDKPESPVAVGLRLLSEADVQTARAEAARLAVELHDDRDGRVAAFNDALMRWGVFRGVTDPNDVGAAFFDMEENVRAALTSQGVRFLWDEIERLHLEESPVGREITPAEFDELRKRLDSIHMLPAGERHRQRKLLAFCLDELRDIDAPE